MAKRRRAKRGRSTSKAGPRRKAAKLNVGKLRREIKALDHRREREPDGMRAALASRAERQERRRALAEKIAPMIAPVLASGGNVRKARAMLARHNRETAALFRKEEATAKKAFAAGFKSRGSVLRPAAVPMTIAGPSPGSPVVHSLTPILIWAKPAWTLVEADYGTVANGARAYTYFSTSSGNDEIEATFWYLWTNATPYAAIINATCTIGYRGLARMYATSGWLYGGSAYLTEGQVELQVYEWWKPGRPRVSRPWYDLTPDVLWTIVHDQGVEGGAIWEGLGEQEQLFRFRHGRTLRYNSLFVPPNGSMVFAVRTHFKYIASGSGGWGGYANVSIDFAHTPGYSIWIPSFTVAVQNPLPPVDPGLVGGGGVLDPG